MSRIKDTILAFLDPSRSTGLFIIGTAALTVAITVIYDTAKEGLGLVGAWGLAIALLIIAGIIMVYQIWYPRKTDTVIIEKERQPDGHQGLILLVSKHEGTSLAAIDYHLKTKGTLRVCWLIASVDTLPVAEALAARYQDQLEKIPHGPGYLVKPDRIKDTHDVVARIYNEEAAEHGLQPHQIIADITGGMKPMTAGMTLACLPQGRNMQYMVTERDEKGEERENVISAPIRLE